jgi:hypothetical protein
MDRLHRWNVLRAGRVHERLRERRGLSLVSTLVRERRVPQSERTEVSGRRG